MKWAQRCSSYPQMATRNYCGVVALALFLLSLGKGFAGQPNFSVTDAGIVDFLRSQASGDMYLDGLTHIALPPRVDTNMVLSSAEDRALGMLFTSGSVTRVNNSEMPAASVVADPSQGLIAVYQHCCSIQQFSVVKYTGKLPKDITVKRLPPLTYAGFSIGSSFVTIANSFGVPLKKSRVGNVWYYYGPRPGARQTCGREWQLRFADRKLSAITISEGC